MRIFDDILTKVDREVIRRGGYGKTRDLGEHPVLMIIDPQYNYTGTDEPILDQIHEWPSGVGESSWRAIERIKRIVSVSRRRSIPIIYTRQIQASIKFDGFAAKTDREQSQYLEGARGTKIVDELAPKKGDLVINKSYSSAFYGTPLLSFLIKLRADTLIVTGGTSSGCIRATCVDAVSRNFNVAVVEDCVFDRISVSHKVALLDLWMKYCDVITSEEAIRYLTSDNGA
ncbi:MAG: isochorismatase family protein [Deltaproteobacteria bacterium]|nr:isochorismatase family protein [Deltaproteobacteria bacterium]